MFIGKKRKSLKMKENPGSKSYHFLNIIRTLTLISQRYNRLKITFKCRSELGHELVTNRSEKYYSTDMPFSQ